MEKTVPHCGSFKPEAHENEATPACGFFFGRAFSTKGISRKAQTSPNRQRTSGYFFQHEKEQATLAS